MVGSSSFAHGLCLGRSANSRLDWIGNRRKQHKCWSRHNNQQRRHNGLSEQCGGWKPNRHSCWPDERDHNRTDNESEQQYDHKLDRNWFDVGQSEHHRNSGHDRKLDHPQYNNRNHSDLTWHDGHYGISRKHGWIHRNNGHECNGNRRSNELNGGNNWQYYRSERHGQLSNDSGNSGQLLYQYGWNHRHDDRNNLNGRNRNNLNPWNRFDHGSEFDKLLLNYKFHHSSLTLRAPIRSSVDLKNALERTRLLFPKYLFR